MSGRAGYAGAQVEVDDLHAVRAILPTSDWHRPKSQVHNLTLLWSSGDGGGFRLLFGLLTRNGSGQRCLEQTPEVVAASLQPQVVIWAAAFSLTSPKHASVPV